MSNTTNPIVYISVNGGQMVPVELDTGSTGLVIESQYVPTQNLGTSIGSGSAGYAGGLNYNYTTYSTTVNFGNGIVTQPTGVDLVSGSAVNSYFAQYGVVGVLGIGPNNGFPGTSTVVPALPGLLNNGVLINEPPGPAEFRPQPAARRDLDNRGAHFHRGVQINNGPLQNVPVMFDSGGSVRNHPVIGARDRSDLRIRAGGNNHFGLQHRRSYAAVLVHDDRRRTPRVSLGRDDGNRV